ELAQVAFAKTASPASRERLAKLLMLDDRYEDVITVLEHAPERSLLEELVAIEAYLSRETAADNDKALRAADRAIALAESDVARAHGLAARGKCETRLGKPYLALQTLRQALALDPHNKDACKRIAAIEVAEGRSDQVLALTEDLFAQGVGHARVFGAQVLAHASAGDFDAARKAEGFDQLHQRQTLSPPPGWESIAAFNAALAEELLAHPDTRYERYGSASNFTWRIENPSRADTPLFNLLVSQIKGAIDGHIAGVQISGHPWAAFRPDPARLRIWCVITEGTGHETWHVHQFGWLSGVYYVSVPEQIVQGDDRKGCLSFGLPDDILGEALTASYGERMVRPEDGLLLTFPSHVYHRTYPHEGEGKRICVAFDLQE
ncbi:MAG: hypothetical protein HC774_05820, partial [Sphingomonadales bacterium]|nr:hypothetical protein [Sphingomonadales bacterium]